MVSGSASKRGGKRSSNAGGREREREREREHERDAAPAPYRFSHTLAVSARAARRGVALRARRELQEPRGVVYGAAFNPYAVEDEDVAWLATCNRHYVRSRVRRAVKRASRVAGERLPTRRRRQAHRRVDAF